MLTPKAASQKGAMWNPCQISMNSNFDMTFVMNFGADNCGADGMAFVLQTNGTGALGADSGEHGYSNGGIGNSVAITFDTYINPGAPYNDPNYDSLGIN